MKTVVDLVSSLKTYITGKDTAAKQAVEQIIAPVETDATSSSAAYSVGDQLTLNDVLYDVIAPISSSDALTVGTNIQAASDISTQIKNVETDISGKQDQMQFSTMPTASATYASKVVIYTGATTATYTSGQSYQCVESSGSYSWEPTAAGSIAASNVTYDGTTSGSSETDAQGAIDDLYALVGTTTTKTLAASATSVQFDVPTSGDNLIDFFISDGSNYTAIDTSVSGSVTLTYESSESARSVSCRISQA